MDRVFGSCLCRAVQFYVDPPYDLAHCYCTRCRKKTGTARATSLRVPPEQVTFSAGEEYIERWYLPSARSFGTSVCRECGCPVPHLTRGRSRMIIPAGSIDSELPVKPMGHWQWSSRANWVDLNESKLPCYD